MNYSIGSPDPIILDVEPFNTTAATYVMTPNWTVKNYTEYKIAVVFNKYSLKLMCPVSVLFNVAAIWTISRLKPFNTSSLYVTLLAIFDSLTMMVKLSHIELTREDVAIGNAGCKILAFVGSFLDQFSIWLLVLLTLERFVAVWLPLKVSSWFTMFRARLGVIVTGMLLAFLNLHLLVTVHQVAQGTERDCRPRPEHMEFFMSSWYWIESCFSAIIPCVLLTVLNILIVYRMRVAMQKQKQMISGSEKPGPTKQSHKTHLTVMLVSVSVAFVFMVMPLAIFNTFRGSWMPTSLHEQAKFILTAEITHFLADCNHVFNFLFYFVSSRRFRRMFFSSLCCQPPFTTPFPDPTTRMSYFKASNSTTNTYYMHASMRANGGV